MAMILQKRNNNENVEGFRERLSLILNVKLKNS